MKRKKAAPAPGRDSAKDLRARAETTLSAANGGEPSPSPEDLERTVHELRVHQIELELQNEELRRAQEELSASRDRYAELYDFSPVGYLILGRGSRIEVANLTAATLLGTERGALLGTLFSRYVDDAREDQDAYYRHSRHTLASPGTHACALRLRKSSGERFHAGLQSCAVSEAGEPEGRVRVVVVDVSAAWEAEAAVQASEARYRALAEQAGVGIYHTTADGQCTYVNPRWCELAGLTPDEAAGGGWVRALHPDDRERVHKAWATAVKERRPFELEYRFRNPAGRVCWLRGTARPLTGDAGRANGYVGTVTDISEARRRAEQLQRSEARFRQLFDQMGIGGVVYEAAGDCEDFVIREINRKGESIGRVRRDEVVGKGVLEVFPAVRDLGLFELFQRVCRSGRPELQEATLYADGRVTAWVENRVFPLTEGEIVALYEDVTERHRAGLAVQESEERYRALFEQAADCILLLEPRADGPPVIAQVNRAGAALHGYTVEEMIGLAVPEFDPWSSPEQIAERVAGFEAGENLVFEVAHRRRDGSVLELLVSGCRIELHGKPFYLTMEKDITARKALERALRESERRFAGILANAPGAVYQYRQQADGSGGFTFLSARAEEVYGYPAEALQEDPSLPWSMIHPDDLPAFRDSVARSAAELAPWRHEYRVRDPKGRVRWLVGRSTPERSEPDGAIVWTGIVLDATERKQMEVALRASEAEFRALFEGAQNPIVLYDAAAVIRRINPVGAANLGATPEDCVGRSLGEFLPGQLEPSRRRFSEVIEAGRALEVEDRLELPDGVRWFWSVVQPVAAGPAGEPLVQVLSYDVTATRQAAEAVQRSDERFRRLAEDAGIGIGLYDSVGRIQYFNRVARLHLGGESEDHVGRTAEEVFGPEWGGRLLDRIRQVLSCGRVLEFEDRVALSGETRWYLSSYGAAHDDAGRTTGVQILSHDISARKAAEAALRDSEARYRGLFEAETDALLVVDAGSLRIEETNRAAQAMFGRTGEELRNCTVLDISAEPEATREVHAEVARREPGASHWGTRRRFLRGDGSEFVGEVASTAFEWQGRQKSLGAVRDITARIARELELGDLTKRLASLRELERLVAERVQSPAAVAAMVLERLAANLGSPLRLSVLLFEPGQDSRVLTVWGAGPASLGAGDRVPTGDCRALPDLTRGAPHLAPDLAAQPSLSVTEGLLRDAGVRSYALLPLLARGRLLGTLNLCFAEPFHPTPQELEASGEVLELLSLALDNALIYRESEDRGQSLRQLAAHLDQTENAERKRLAQELHDRVGQNLTALGINLNILHARVAADPAAAARLEDCLGLVDETGKRIRDLMGELRPSVLDDYGLRAGLRWLAEQFEQRTGIRTTVDGGEFAPRLDGVAEGVVFRVVQEALSNVAKHASARRAWVELSEQVDACRVAVRDDGVGFDAGQAAVRADGTGWGLPTMAERMQALGGALEIHSRPGEGTTVVSRVSRGPEGSPAGAGAG